ncbi:unnamed protein product [Linum trigynum]|uniref:Uncharacterized protein n=1 Tax=Linum trigynum TaxID=586398 RepID=A0AAV2GMQ1_9ROSI
MSRQPRPRPPTARSVLHAGTRTPGPCRDPCPARSSCYPPVINPTRSGSIRSYRLTTPWPAQFGPTSGPPSRPIRPPLDSGPPSPLGQQAQLLLLLWPNRLWFFSVGPNRSRLSFEPRPSSVFPGPCHGPGPSASAANPVR